MRAPLLVVTIVGCGASRPAPTPVPELSNQASDDTAGERSRRAPGADLEEQIRRAEQDAPVGAGDPDAGGEVATGGRIVLTDKRMFDETSLTAEHVAVKLQNVYLPGIRDCYQAQLAKDATARGKIRVALRVSPMGKATHVQATGFVRALDQCIVGRATSWRFPIPLDRDGEATEAGFQFVFALSPD